MTTALEVSPAVRSRCVRHMPCAPESARVARRLVAEKFTAWGREDLIENAQLVVSELVGNAARHTGCTRLCVLLRLEGTAARIAVRDSSFALPVVLHTGERDENGRGMGLVDLLSKQWGVEEAPFGKWVWSLLA
ncbi:ATP-binding protein [Kitasatospora sp. GP82]|uniref:ATP-binding protein n=1 Tax=Kitasatospora sp. GP82 TaxID=3035089 RepID=UPI0024771B67|nr:ATP-binding protein [Kitasatospora sp. GP82]MDH6130016.1 anti-sigma regulatory factor (Ser/Thr protein kinase) [Kitasatospora sp. GP82]